MIINYVHLHLQPDQEHVFLKASKLLIQASRAEAGNVSYDLLKSTEQDFRYNVVEIWRDAQTFETHIATEHLATFLQQAPRFLAAPMDMHAFDGQPLHLQ
ncbi:putative quinol monooxygenase [Planococcus kocurii]|uniref:putative quinol monooxygenase n=1 Tax=Planococcus kocurii TaxID=1374 RepID=UPI003D015267